MNLYWRLWRLGIIENHRTSLISAPAPLPVLLPPFSLGGDRRDDVVLPGGELVAECRMTFTHNETRSLIPYPSCTCGWYVCADVGQLQPLFARLLNTDVQEYAITGVRAFGHREVSPARSDPPGTLRFNRISIVGPVALGTKQPGAAAWVAAKWGMQAFDWPLSGRRGALSGRAQRA